MKKLAYGAFLLMGAMAITACGGGSGDDDDDDDVTLPDGGGDDDDDDDLVDAGPPPPGCNPVAETGCGPEEKCTYVVENADPFLARTACTPNGTVALDDACALATAEGALPEYDNCVSGTYCINGTCKEICSTAPNTCGAGFVCSTYENTFDDIEGTGVCDPGCDPVAQNCVVETDACYTQIAGESGSCGAVASGAAELEQDDVCFGPGVGQCYLNGCAKGFGGLLPADAEAPDIDRCAAFCTPANTSTDTVNNPGPADGVHSDETGFGACADREALGYQCRFLNSFYGGAEITPDSVGFCVDPEVWGDCTSMDPATQLDANGVVVFGCISTNFEPPAFQAHKDQRRQLPEGFIVPALPSDL